MPMTKSANRKTAILAVSGNHADLSRLRCLFAGSGWELITAESLADAGQSLQRNMVPVVLCESRLPDGDWKALLLMVNQLAHPPKLIVTSRHADETLWAEALNLGAFDVLADPPRQKDVFRALSSAWRSWKARPHLEHPQTMRAPIGCGCYIGDLDTAKCIERKAFQTCPLLLADASCKPSHEASVWEHGTADC